MNTDQIKNGEIRIFPFYKGTYMGKSDVEFGFSSEASARKYMADIPSDDIYESIGGYEKYYWDNAYIHKYRTDRLYRFWLCGKEYEKGCYEVDYSSERQYLKELPNAIEIKNAVDSLKDSIMKDKEGFKKFEETYGYFPNIYVDDEPFKKARRKFIKDNVQFKKGVVKVSVEYLDE